MNITGYPFVSHAKPEDARTFTEEEAKKFIKGKYSGGCIFGINELAKSGIYREMGFSYNFRALLNKYLIQDNYGGFQSAFAPNKGALRRALYLNRSDKVFDFPTK